MSVAARQAAPLAAVLLDLDGTLADTAADLAHALNRLRDEQGMAPLAVSELRPYVPQGARGMLACALDIGPQDADYARLRDRFLTIYAESCARQATVFDGFEDVLDQLRGRGLRIGIVTNKLERFATPLLRALGVWPDADCLITPDLLRLPKPDPEGVLLACERLGVAPAASVFVGDDPRDIAAGQAAGTRTVVAGYGYIAPGEDVTRWGADACIDSPADLLALCRDWGA
ncbi:HAD family hydrolase [Immundisolibacter cernigliae]|uniref:HAD family hydrolase n=1 Tax=Immundisolibacter cernigliae TaxID=1810504 RepID=UPI00192CF4D0|nr:HAD-IA family hydrolase [Immundisolibacter cernigliae]